LQVVAVVVLATFLVVAVAVVLEPAQELLVVEVLPNHH
jgi:hypothetical protein